MDDAPHLIGKILHEEVTPEQVMAAVGATAYRIETLGGVYTCDWRPERVRISVSEDKRITNLHQG